MKYSRNDLNHLLYKDYILLIAEELNKNGFTDENGKRYEVETVSGNFVSNFSVNFILSIKDKEAIEFLKGIGLLNNGRCPLTGLMLNDKTKTLYSSEHDSNINYEISTALDKYINMRRNWGCLISFFIIIIGIVIVIINGFNYVIAGIAILLAILTGRYGAVNYSNNTNISLAANELGINIITLHYILKVEELEEKEDIPIPVLMVRYGIPFADYMRWSNE